MYIRLQDHTIAVVKEAEYDENSLKSMKIFYFTFIKLTTFYK